MKEIVNRQKTFNFHGNFMYIVYYLFKYKQIPPVFISLNYA